MSTFGTQSSRPPASSRARHLVMGDVRLGTDHNSDKTCNKTYNKT